MQGGNVPAIMGVISMTDKTCQQERHANGSSLLNIGAKIHPTKGIRTSNSQVIGNEQTCESCTKLSNDIGPRISQTIGDEPHKDSAQDLPMILGQETPKQ